MNAVHHATTMALQDIILAVVTSEVYFVEEPGAMSNGNNPKLFTSLYDGKSIIHYKYRKDNINKCMMISSITSISAKVNFRVSTIYYIALIIDCIIDYIFKYCIIIMTYNHWY